MRTLDPNTLREKGSVGWEGWDEDWKDEEENVDEDESRGGKRKRHRKRLLVELGNTRMEEVGEEESGRCRFWEALGDRLEQFRGV